MERERQPYRCLTASKERVWSPSKRPSLQDLIGFRMTSIFLTKFQDSLFLALWRDKCGQLSNRTIALCLLGVHCTIEEVHKPYFSIISLARNPEVLSISAGRKRYEPKYRDSTVTVTIRCIKRPYFDAELKIDTVRETVTVRQLLI